MSKVCRKAEECDLQYLNEWKHCLEVPVSWSELDIYIETMGIKLFISAMIGLELSF